MGSEVEPIPETMSIEEAADFWSSHSVADYASEVVEVELDLRGTMRYVAIDGEILSRLERRAAERGISLETLINLWLQERLSA
jgi:hypothetical protein